MKTIPLTQGQIAKVSDKWYEELNQFKWYAKYDSGTKSFYATRNIPTLFRKQKMIYMHRVIAGTPDGMQCDHVDHDTLNNQDENLRNCTPTQNQCNRGKQVSNTSGFKGVSADRNNWMARIQVNDKRLYLGTYPTREEAAHAYDEAAKKYHGEFARLNKELKHD
jgi:hypothetical protein